MSASGPSGPLVYFFMAKKEMTLCILTNSQSLDQDQTAVNTIRTVRSTLDLYWLQESIIQIHLNLLHVLAYVIV